MNRLALCVPLLLSMTLLCPSLSGQCSAIANGTSQDHAMTQIAFAQGLPSHITGGITGGLGQWNDCNTNSWDWPWFTTGTGAAQEIVTVLYTPGEGPACGLWDGGTTITVWDFYIDGDIGVDCTHSADAVSDTIAHELGHYMGLAETLCVGHIMGPITIDSTGRVKTTNQISAEEKDAVDDINTNDEEYFEEVCGGLQECDGQNDGNSPILLDLDGGWFKLTGLAESVSFDIDGDWEPELLGWTSLGSGDGFLFLNRYKSPWVDDGSELFGDSFRSLLTGERSAHGYIPLAELDLPAMGGNANGRIDSGDAFFARLGVWIDSNRDGASVEGECFGLEELGIRWLDTDYKETSRRDRHGNEFLFISKGRREESGKVQGFWTADVFFVIHP